MSRAFDFIKDLNKDRDIWKIAVRVTDSWTVTGTNGSPHLEMVIQDGKGDCIKAVTRFKEYDHWKDFIVDQQTYVLYNCHVYDNDSNSRVCDGPFKVVFGSGTKFTKDVEERNIPPHEFKFKSFKDVQAGKFKINVLYDVIGVIHEVIKNVTYANGKKACTNLIIANESGETVDLTLWEAYSVQLMTYISDRKENGPIVLVLTHAQCKLGDNGRPHFSNNWSGSKLFINGTHPAFSKFKSSYQDIDKSPAATQDFTQVSSSSQLTKGDDFSNMSQVKSIAQMKLTEKDSYCITIGRTKKFNPNQFGWYYESCSKCTKSARNMGGQYTCICGEEVKAPIARYKVVVQVEFQGHKADFVFWDTQCHDILGTTAQELRETMQKLGEDDPKIYPVDLDKLLNIELAFKVKYQPYYRQASINHLSDDSTVLAKIKLHMNISTSQSAGEPSSIPLTSEKEKNHCSDSLNFPTQSLSACGETDFEISSNITPAKPASTSLGFEDLGSPSLGTTQLSSTKTTKRPSPSAIEEIASPVTRSSKVSATKVSKNVKIE